MYAVLMKQMLYLKMLAWLEDNIYCNPAIDDLAQYMGYSRRFVYDVFYQYGQLPIGQYIRLRRLTIAAVSLRLTRQPIAAIAWQLSYDSPQTFSREFKKRFSLSPREYRCAAHWDTAKLLKKFHPGQRAGATPSDVIILFFYDICAKKAFHPCRRRVRSGR